MLAIISVLIGVCGIVTSKVQGCCSIGTFSFLSLLGFVVFAVLGSVAIVVDISSKEVIDEFCANDQYENRFAVNVARNFLNLIDKADKVGNEDLD